MGLQEKINNDLKQAMKSGDQETLSVLRMINAAFSNKNIEKRGKGQSEQLTDEEVLEILNRELKKRKEAINLYTQGNRQDLASQEEKEAAIIQKYLPAQMSKEEVSKHVEKIVMTLRQAQGDISFGDIMKEVNKELKGKADGKLIADIVKSLIS